MTWEPAPSRPPPPESGVHVWRARLDYRGWPGPGELPPEDRDRAGRFLRAEPARLWTAARWALRLAIAAYLAEDPGAVDFETSPNGKPRLSPDASIRFNLSHSQDLALIGIASGREVGIDVERAAPGRDFLSLARNGLDPRAARAVSEAPVEERARVFYDAWVRREAVAKCFGEGLGAPAPEAPVEVVPLDVGAGWAAAVALAGAGPLPIRCFDLVPRASRGGVSAPSGPPSRPPGP